MIITYTPNSDLDPNPTGPYTWDKVKALARHWGVFSDLRELTDGRVVSASWDDKYDWKPLVIARRNEDIDKILVIENRRRVRVEGGYVFYDRVMPDMCSTTTPGMVLDLMLGIQPSADAISDFAAELRNLAQPIVEPGFPPEDAVEVARRLVRYAELFERAASYRR